MNFHAGRMCWRCKKAYYPSEKQSLSFPCAESEKCPKCSEELRERRGGLKEILAGLELRYLESYAERIEFLLQYPGQLNSQDERRGLTFKSFCDIRLAIALFSEKKPGIVENTRYDSACQEFNAL